MVVSKNSRSQRIVESLINDEQFNNVNKLKIEKSKVKNGKKSKKEKLNEPKNDLSVKTQNKINQFDEFITATPDYLSAQTYQQQQQDIQNQITSPGLSNVNSSPIQTDYYSIYNQLATNTLLSNVLGYNPITLNQQVNPYYSPVSNVSTSSPVYSAYSDVEHSSYPMYSPNYYSYPLSAPITYNGYIMPYDLSMPETPVKTKRASKKKNIKKQALKDYINHEQQVIAQFHKNITENKMNKIAGKKKTNKDQKELNRRNRKIASKNLKINTNSTKKVKPIFNRIQIINESNNTKKVEKSNENKPIFNSFNVFPKYTEPNKKESNQYEPSHQDMKPQMIKNVQSDYSFDKLPKKNTNIEFLLNNELILSFLNNVYNGFNWTSKLTNSKTNKNIGFLTKNNDSTEVYSWKDSQTPGQKYSIASLLSMANNPMKSGSIATERRVARKELYEYWSKMARKSMLENGKNESEKAPTTKNESYIHRMIQNKAISKSNDKMKQLNKMLNKKSSSVNNEKEPTTDLFTISSNHPLSKLNYLNVNININSNNKNNHPIAARFNEYYNRQQNMTVPKNNHGKSLIGRNVIEMNNDNDNSMYKESTESQTQQLLNNDDPNKLYEYLLNLNFESSKKTTSSSKNFASADMLKPNYSSSQLNQQPNDNQYERIPTFTSPTLNSIPAPVSNEVNPQYSFNYSNPSPFNYKFPLLYPQTMNYFNIINSTENETNDSDTSSKKNKKGKKGKSSKNDKEQKEEYSNKMPLTQQYWNNINNNNSILTALPQSFSNASLLSVASTASSSIQEMDFSNVRAHYDFIIPKALPKKANKSKENKKHKDKSNVQKGKSTLSQVQNLNENDNVSEPDYSLINLIYNSDYNLNQPYNEKLSNYPLESVNKNGNNETSNTSLVGYMFNSNDSISKSEHSNTSLVGYMFN